MGRQARSGDEDSGAGCALRGSRKYVLTDGEWKGLTTRRPAARMTLHAEHVTALRRGAHAVAGSRLTG